MDAAADGPAAGDDYAADGGIGHTMQLHRGRMGAVQEG